MTIQILPGYDRQGKPEQFQELAMESGTMTAIVGDTGSGKTRLIQDIEQFVDGDSVTGRRVLLDGEVVPPRERRARSRRLIAHLGQNMRFVLDMRVDDFLMLHARCRDKDVRIEEVLAMANDLTPERINTRENLNLLSGGQARALMIADMAMICESPVVLIDELENAGLDKQRAFDSLKLSQGAVTGMRIRTEGEKKTYEKMSAWVARQRMMLSALKEGREIS